MESLAIKYRPKMFSDVCEQSATLIILQQQLNSGDIKNCYLFCGPAGCGKTTCARIFANEINEHKGVPIELDAASNNSVDNIREIITQAKTASIDSKYKVFIMDEVHALSNSAWQAMLKMLEEPPMRTVFIMCTTNPEKIPKTILSRVQRFDFQRISQQGIVDRLKDILCDEFDSNEEFQKKLVASDTNVLPYIAKLAQGGMRDAITMLDKCLAYSPELTMDNVLKALGIAEYDYLMRFISNWYYADAEESIKVLNEVYMSGYDLKQFIHSVTLFVLDICKYTLTEGFKYLTCPETEQIKTFLDRSSEYDCNEALLSSLLRLERDIKWDTNPKSHIEAWIITRGE